MSFKIGDRVRIPRNDKTGEVVDVCGMSINVRLDIPSLHGWKHCWYSSESLELLDEVSSLYDVALGAIS